MWVLCISPESNERLQLLQAHDRRTSEAGGCGTSLSVVVVVAVREVAVTVMKMSDRIKGVLLGFENLGVSLCTLKGCLSPHSLYQSRNM